MADDNRDSANSMGMLLENDGYCVQVAHDGRSALELAENLRPHIVILDIGMPELNGYETVTQMRARPWASATFFIALTGWGQKADRERAFQAGFHRHLVKPADPDELLRFLRSIQDEPPILGEAAGLP